MGLIDDAIALERKAEGNYRTAGLATADGGAKKILDLLADEEAAHAAALAEMTEVKGLEGPDLLEAARAWVRGAVEGGTGAISSDAGLREILERAMDLEQTTEAFYREQASFAEAKQRELLLSLADAEKRHYQLVSSLVIYFDRPNEWVESAEFGLREEY